MKKMIYLLILTLMVIQGKSQDSKNLKLYIGTFTSEGSEGIYLCDFNSETGDLQLSKVFKGVDNPNFLKISTDRNFMYVTSRPSAVIEKSGGYVSAYKIEKNGDVKFINKQSANGMDPCHVDVSSDGKYVATATYGSGTVSLFPVDENGGLLPASAIIQNEGSGPNLSRQAGPHAHSIKFSDRFHQVFSADLGTDQLNIYQLENNKLVQRGQEFVKLLPGSGPRHFEFHPTQNVIYVINELNSTISVLKKEGTEWKINQSISTLSDNYNGVSYCADIHITPDGTYLYGSNRGENSIAVFVVENISQKLIPVGNVSTEGNWPRNFALSPDGNFLLVANQKSGNIAVFKINKETGIPEFTRKEIKIPSPVCLEFY